MSPPPLQGLWMEAQAQEVALTTHTSQGPREAWPLLAACLACCLALPSTLCGPHRPAPFPSLVDYPSLPSSVRPRASHSWIFLL